MALITHVTLRGVSKEQYDAVRALAGWMESPPGGGLAHLTWWEGDDCHNVDAWESEAAFAEFGERRLGPAMAQAGVDVAPEVTFTPAHEVFAPSAQHVAPTATTSTAPTDHVEALRRGYAAFAAGDIPAVLALMDEQVVWTTPETLPFGGRYVGPDALLGFFGSLPQTFAELSVQPEEFVHSGDTVAVLGRHRGRSAAGVAFELPFVHVWAFRGDKASAFTEHLDSARLNTILGLIPQAGSADADAARPGPDGSNAEAAVRRMFDEVINAGRLEVVDELITEDFVDHGPMGDVHGREEFRQTIAAWRAAVPDVRCEISGVVSEGDTVAWLVRTTGTHTGDDLGVPATGKRFDTVSANLARFRDGRAQEHWSEQGLLSMLTQIGVLSLPAPTSV